MAQFNSFGNDNRGFSRYLDKRRRFEKYDDKPFGDNFPFFIEKKENDSDEFYRGICEGAKAVYGMWRSGIFEGGSIPVTYFSLDMDRSISYKKYMSDDIDEDFVDEIYEDGYECGFKQGYKSACEETETDIYIDSDKICKIDQLHNELLELGRSLHPWDIDKLNSVLKRVVELKYDVVKEAVDEYLGYK